MQLDPSPSVYCSTCYRECFLTIEEMENVRKFKAAINRSFTCRGGIFVHGIKDDQLSRYLMAKIQEFSLGVGREMTSSLVIKRQPNPRQVNAEGEFVDENDPTAVI